MSNDPALPGSDQLAAALADHSSRFSPWYDGYLSDHGPMAALALIGLGAGADDALDYLHRYSARLQPLADAPAGYQRSRARLEKAIAADGADAVLAQQLPTQISGWVRDAFHPLIRIAYGYEFGIDAEVAAGLAYLDWCGPDPQLEAIAASFCSREPAADPAAAFNAVRPGASSVGPGRTFSESQAAVVNHPMFEQGARPVATPLPAFSRTALEVFASTHDFFALHLVTGAAAFQILHEFAGARRDELFCLGLLSGYAAVGAPPFEPIPHEPAGSGADPILIDALRPLGGLDEHVIKLAQSANQHATSWSDPSYRTVARRYINRTLARQSRR